MGKEIHGLNDYNLIANQTYKFQQVEPSQKTQLEDSIAIKAQGLLFKIKQDAPDLKTKEMKLNNLKNDLNDTNKKIKELDDTIIILNENKKTTNDEKIELEKNKKNLEDQKVAYETKKKEFNETRIELEKDLKLLESKLNKLSGKDYQETFGKSVFGKLFYRVFTQIKDRINKYEIKLTEESIGMKLNDYYKNINSLDINASGLTDSINSISEKDRDIIGKESEINLIEREVLSSNELKNFNLKIFEKTNKELDKFLDVNKDIDNEIKDMKFYKTLTKVIENSICFDKLGDLDSEETVKKLKDNMLILKINNDTFKDISSKVNNFITDNIDEDRLIDLRSEVRRIPGLKNVIQGDLKLHVNNLLKIKGLKDTKNEKNDATLNDKIKNDYKKTLIKAIEVEFEMNSKIIERLESIIKEGYESLADS